MPNIINSNDKLKFQENFSKCPTFPKRGVARKKFLKRVDAE
jgi:hypothetical protein